MALLATDSGEYVEVMLACMKLGVVYVPLNNRLTDAEVLTLLRRAEPKAIFAGSRYAARVAALAAQLDGLCFTFALDGEDLLPFGDLLAEGTDTEPGVEVDDEDVLALAFTSGTTGLPKGVLQSQRMINALALQMSVDYQILLDEFRYTASPTFHIAGPGDDLHAHPARVPHPDPAAVRGGGGAALDAGRPPDRGLPGADDDHPAARRPAGSRGQLREHPFGHLRGVADVARPAAPGHERVRVRLHQRVRRGDRGRPADVAVPADHRRAAAGAEHLLGSIGKPAFAVDLRLVDESGKDVPQGEVGEIITRSRAVMSGYLAMPSESAQAVRDGWFWGGDLARMDSDGYLYLAGRSKDMIIRGGENIYPVEIETVIADYPEVTAVAVVGQPDEHWGEIVVAFVTASEGSVIEQESLRSFCRERLAAYKVPAVVTVIDDMPLNASGKILKRELRARL